jgi:hypothetical protein
LTIRPKPPNPDIPVGPADVLSLRAEFTVDSAAGQVSGSKRLAAPVKDGASYGGCGGQCEPVIEIRLSDLNYGATITTTSGVFADRGRATFNTTLREGFGSCRVHEFRETFTSSLSSPEQQGSVLFGKRSPGSSFSAMSANAKRASPFTLYFPATVRKLHAYVEGDFFNRRDSQVLRAVLYARGPDGGPGTRLGQTFQFTVPGGMSRRWLVLYMAPPVRLNPGVYWIGIHSGATGGVARFAWSPVDNSRRFNVDFYPDGPSDPFGSAPLDNQQMSIFASGSY